MTLDIVVAFLVAASAFWGVLRGSERQTLPLFGLAFAALLTWALGKSAALHALLAQALGDAARWAPAAVMLVVYGSLRLWMAAAPLRQLVKERHLFAPLAPRERLAGLGLGALRACALVLALGVSLGSAEAALLAFESLGLPAQGTQVAAALSEVQKLRALLPADGGDVPRENGGGKPPGAGPVSPIDAAQQQARAYERGAVGRAHLAEDIAEGRAERVLSGAGKTPGSQGGQGSVARDTRPKAGASRSHFPGAR